MNQPLGLAICADYVSEDEIPQIRYNELTADSNDVEKEDGYKVILYYRYGIYHHIMSDLGRNKAFWQNGILGGCIAGNISEEEMIEMINSIYKGK